MSGSGSSTISIPQTAAAGGITITQPPQTATSYFKIAPSQTVTFAWNFTSLYVTPTALTISAIGENGNTYPVGPTNGIIPGTQSSVLWDLYSYQQANPSLPLAQGSYRLTVVSDRGPTALAAPGLFSNNGNLQFALYTPQAYTPLASGWQCIGCSSAISSLTAHPGFIALIATFVVMFLSGWNVLRHH